MPEENIDKKGVLKAMGIALAASLLGIGILGWQYHRLEKQQLPALEEKIEQNSAQDVLERFLETRSDSLLTERAMEQKGFVLESGVKDYEILRIERLAEGNYRFLVQMGDFIEVITLVKILDKYYIDAVEIAG